MRKGGLSMKILYFTVTGTNHRYGHKFAEPGMKVKLVKEPDNEYDKEAIKVEMSGLGQIGYVANSPYTIVGESYSAGRLYDKIGDEEEGEILYKLSNALLCTIKITEKIEENEEDCLRFC